MAPSPGKVRPALVPFLDDTASGLPTCARDTFSELYEPRTELDARIERVTHRVERVYRAHPVCRKLAAVPGLGPLTATALVATVGRPLACHNGRHLAAWLGLVPRHYSRGGKERVGGISNRGSRSVRTRLIHGARAGGQRAERRPDTQGRWLGARIHRTGTHVAAVAVANNKARVIWALSAHDAGYRPPASAPAGSSRSLRGSREPHDTRRIHTTECRADIRADTRGTPSACRPWTHCRPQPGRYAHEEHARVWHQGPDTSVVHGEAG